MVVFKVYKFAKNQIMTSKFEIMSPAGSMESLIAAIQGGADSVYFGAGNLNMRSRSSVNFSVEDISEIAGICKENNVKSYLTLNSILYDEDLSVAKNIILKAKQAGISAVIISDISLITFAAKAGVDVHISTQCNITNIEAVKFYSQFANVMVLARELTLPQIKHITDLIDKENIKGPSGEKVKIEIFAHGALCMAVSGRCYLSLHTFNASANRGACFQPCRHSYKAVAIDDSISFEVDNPYIFSPKDLCTIDFLDKIADCGINILKIEGRGRSPEYVKTVTQCYKEASIAIDEKSYNEDKIINWKNKLHTVYNRGFWGGYYLGKKMGEWAKSGGSQATRKKEFIGKVENFFSDISVAQVGIETGNLQKNDEIIIIGKTTGVVEMKLPSVTVEGVDDVTAKKGDACTFKTDTLVRRGDQVYKFRTTDPY